NSGMSETKADLIFCTDHSLTLYTSYPGYFHCQRLAVCRMQSGAWFCDNHFLSHCYIRCSTNDLQWISRVNIHGSYSKLIRVGLLFASQDFTYYKTFKASFHIFIFIKILDLESD